MNNYSEALLTGNGLTLGEALSMGGQTTAIGLGIVFGVLVVLMLVLILFKVIFYKDPSKQKKETEAEQQPVAEVIQAQEVKDETDEEELIAILTAAVAASLNTSTYNLQIKSYRRVDDRRPSWNKAGLRETISNRF